MIIPIYQVDAFTSELFKGNPAAVCFFDSWPEDKLMQNIAAENNLAETAFIVKSEGIYELRWFTPAIEVDLCGHATLASAYVVDKHKHDLDHEVLFHTRKSGTLKVRKENSYYVMDFPADRIEQVTINDDIQQAITSPIKAVFKGKTDYLIVLNDENAVRNYIPDMALLNNIDARGIIITAKAKNVDFVSRFFGPRVGVPEDPVTGSAHTTLTPYWSHKLNKLSLEAEQLSARGGKIKCTLKNDRVLLAGKAREYLVGEITI